MAPTSTAPGPTASFAGSNPDRQSVGLPGHCERCAQLGHVQAHKDFGCGDVGCDRAHGPADEAAARTSEGERDRRAALAELFAEGADTYADEDDARKILDELRTARRTLAKQRRLRKASFPTSLPNRLVIVLADGSSGNGPMTDVAASELSESHQLLLADEGTDVDVAALADIVVADLTERATSTALLISRANAAAVPVVLVGRGSAHLIEDLVYEAAEMSGYGSTAALVSYLGEAVVRLARR